MGHHHGRQTHRTGGRAEPGGYLHLPEAVICFSEHISAIARIRKLMIEGHVRDFCESSLQQGLLFVLYLCNCIEAGRGKASTGHRFFTE